jgi:AraC-like DNA-binding protein
MCGKETGVPAPSPQLLRFSSEMLPQRDRFAAFREEFARQVLNVDWVDLSGGTPRIDLAFFNFGPVAGGTLGGTAAEFIRNVRHVKDGADDFMLHIVVAGSLHTRHAGEDGFTHTGSGYFSDQGRPQFSVATGNVKVRNITVAPAALKALVADPEDRAGRIIRPGPALRLLEGYLASLETLDALPPPELCRLIGLHLVDLVAAALGPTAEGREAIAERGLKAARLLSILAEITRQSGNPAISVDAIAHQHGISRRNLQRLLEETGKSFIEHLTERRLERSYAMLTDRRYVHLRIIDIAFATGFGDVSHFNRMFQRRFGDTPSAVRASTCHDLRG